MADILKNLNINSLFGQFRDKFKESPGEPIDTLFELHVYHVCFFICFVAILLLVVRSVF